MAGETRENIQGEMRDVGGEVQKKFVRGGIRGFKHEEMLNRDVVDLKDEKDVVGEKKTMAASLRGSHMIRKRGIIENDPIASREWDKTAFMRMQKDFAETRIVPKVLVGNFLDEGVVGELGTASLKELVNPVNVNEARQMASEYGFSTHPITKRNRVVTVLMKLEELALKGNVVAAKEFLDRVVGKVPEVSFVGVSKYESMSDSDLLNEIKQLKK